MNYRKHKKREGKPQLISQPSEINIKNNLPLRHFYQESLS